LYILTKIIVYLMFGGNKPKPDRTEIPKVIDGRYFIEKSITNFSEEDFALWLLSLQIEDKSFTLFDMIRDALTNYDFSEIYEDIAERKERHKAGEYYTPKWLVGYVS